MISGISVWLQSGHSKGSMPGSNVEETSEQTHGKEIEPTIRGKAGRINLIMSLPTWRQG